jgi:hypothetical protein
MHTVAKPARSKAKNRAEKWAVDEAIRKLALRAAKIKKVQPSYTPHRVSKKFGELEKRERPREFASFPGRTSAHAEMFDFIHPDIKIH